MTDTPTPPDLSVVIVTLGGVNDLAVALPGLLRQTIAARIELIVVCATGAVSRDDVAGLTGLHSVRVVERATIGNRGRDAAAGVAVAGAPFVALHENHTRSEPTTFETMLAAFRPSDAAVSPVIYPANGEMAWGNAMYALAHAHAAPPNDDGDKRSLVLHSSLYRTHLLAPFGEGLADEAAVQESLVAAGHTLRYAPGTVVWHVNEARPGRVMFDSFTLGRRFGRSRSRSMGWAERAGRALLVAPIAAMNVRRCLGNCLRTAATRTEALRSAGPVAVAASCFALGEVVGYFERAEGEAGANELHEFHVRGRLNGATAAARWLEDAVAALPEGAP